MISVRHAVFVGVLVALQHFLTQYRLDIHNFGRRLQGLLWEDAKRERLIAQAVGSSKQRSESLQPDAVRSQSHASVGSAPCHESIYPQSSYTSPASAVRARAATTYRGLHGGKHTWSYRVWLKNVHSQRTVQMLTRHWVFTDSAGRVDEVKGPGARGSTPILGPGEEWSYESGTQLATKTGSMVGSFQFEVLDTGGSTSSVSVPASRTAPGAGTGVGGSDGTLAAGDLFSAPVARTALMVPSDSGIGKGDVGDDSWRTQSIRVPCGNEAKASTWALTSVAATRRVIVGATAQAQTGRPGWYQYDVQVNNARTHPVRIVSHRWTVTTAHGEVHLDGNGLGGTAGSEVEVIAPGEATRYLGHVSMARDELRGSAVAPPPRTGVLKGSLAVVLEPDEEELEVAIAPLGLSASGEPVSKELTPES